MDAAGKSEKQSRATRLVQHLMEQEALLVGYRHMATNDQASSCFALSFEELFGAPQAVEDMRPNGDGMTELTQWTEHHRQWQSQQDNTPMEGFVAMGRTFEPSALYGSLQMAEMGILEGDPAHANTRAYLLQVVDGFHGTHVGAQGTSSRDGRASRAQSRARSEPYRTKKMPDSTQAERLSLRYAQSI